MLLGATLVYLRVVTFQFPSLLATLLFAVLVLPKHFFTVYLAFEKMTEHYFLTAFVLGLLQASQISLLFNLPLWPSIAISVPVVVRTAWKLFCRQYSQFEACTYQIDPSLKIALVSAGLLAWFGCLCNGVCAAVWVELLELPAIRRVKAALHRCPPRMQVASEEDDILDVFGGLLKKFDNPSAQVHVVHSIYCIFRYEIGTLYHQ